MSALCPSKCASETGYNLIYQYEAGNPSSGAYINALKGLDEGMRDIIKSLHESLIEPDDF